MKSKISIIVIVVLTILISIYQFYDQTLLDYLYIKCIRLLENVTGNTHRGYQLINVILFMFIQPALILIFFILWRSEKSNRIEL